MKQGLAKVGRIFRSRWLISLIGIGLVAYLSRAMFGSVTWKELRLQYFNGIYLTWLVAAVLVVLWLAGAERDFARGLRIALFKVKDISRMELQRAARAVGCAEKAAVVSGIVCVIIAAMDLSYNLYRYIIPEAVGVALAVIFTYILYPGLLVLMLTPVKIRLERMVISYMEDPEDEEAEKKEAEGQRVYFGLRAMGLTDREAEVARLAGKGMSNGEIGKELYIATATVKKHMTHILEKTGCGDREALGEKVRGL